ncbi:MAG: peptidase MA family metallohydrolase [Lentisphaeraceae bacterium]|nr:peptidase MA family metallohydrolase [Lentisphaeraceae bacterium]
MKKAFHIVFFFIYVLTLPVSSEDKLTQHFREGNYEEALKLVDDWASIHTKFDLLKTLGQYEKAYEIWNRTSSKNYDIAVLEEGIEIFQMLGKPEEAQKILKKVNFLVENQYNIYKPIHLVICGKVLLKSGAEPTEIIKNYYEKALKADPVLKEAYLAAADLCFAKDDFAAASKFLNRANKNIPNDPDILLYLAKAFKDSDPKTYGEALKQIEEINKNHAPTLKHTLFEAILKSRTESAQAAIPKLQKLNVKDPEFLAIMACHSLENGEEALAKEYRVKALNTFKNNFKVDLLIAQYLSFKGFFEESNKFVRNSLRINPDNQETLIELAMNFLRLGQTEKAFDLAQKIYDKDPYNITAFNLVQLQDVFDKLEVIEHENFIIRMSKFEASIYADEVKELLSKARVDLNGKYGFEPKGKVFIDFFEDADDFAIRNFAYPLEFGALGICFGNVVTMKSFSAQDTVRNWKETLWHEYAHVVTLGLSNKKVPRWFTEGISVYEEWQGPHEWGMEFSPAFYGKIKAGELYPVAKLNEAFHGQDVMFAYFQSGLLVKYIAEKYGFEKIKSTLKTLAKSKTPNEALKSEFGSLETLDNNFKTFIQKLADKTINKADLSALPKDIDPRDSAQVEKFLHAHQNNIQALQLKASLLEEVAVNEKIEVYKKIIQLYPSYTEEGNAYQKLAVLYNSQEDESNELKTLETFHTLNAHNTESLKRLIELYNKNEDFAAATVFSKRLIAVNPITSVAWTTLGKIAEMNKQDEAAINYYRAALKCKDLISSTDTHFSLAKLLKNKDSITAKRHLLKCLEQAPRFRKAYALLEELK